jgi:hypothetical protein
MVPIPNVYFWILPFLDHFAFSSVFNIAAFFHIFPLFSSCFNFFSQLTSADPPGREGRSGNIFHAYGTLLTSFPVKRTKTFQGTVWRAIFLHGLIGPSWHTDLNFKFSRGSSVFEFNGFELCLNTVYSSVVSNCDLQKVGISANVFCRENMKGRREKKEKKEKRKKREDQEKIEIAR